MSPIAHGGDAERRPAGPHNLQYGGFGYGPSLSLRGSAFFLFFCVFVVVVVCVFLYMYVFLKSSFLNVFICFPCTLLFLCFFPNSGSFKGSSSVFKWYLRISLQLDRGRRCPAVAAK